jgi:adenosylcobinamide-GDP ribazoletransferase
MSAVAGARLAFSFLTVVPAGRVDGGGGAWLARAAAWFPVVGALVGGVGAAVVAVSAWAGVDAPVAGALGIVSIILVTRGLHEDGLADTADGLGVHGPRERRLAAMRDSAVGAHGALAMACALLLAALALGGLTTADAARALVAAHVLARGAMVLAAALLGDARADGLGPGLRVGAPAAVVAGAAAAASTLAVCGPAAGAVAVVAFLVALVVALGVQARAFGGRTGDTLGATGKLVEVAVLVALAGAWA